MKTITFASKQTVSDDAVALSDKEKSEGIFIDFGGSKTYVSPDHFKRQNDIERIKRLLKRSLNRVHVEVFAYCNRRCGFCPDVAGTRITNKTHLSEEIYLRVLSDLREIGYDKLFGFHQYNEPLADRIIITRISQARDYLPGAFLSINSNGDYLNIEYLNQLIASGLNNLTVSIYGPKNGEFIDDVILKRMQTLANKLKIDFKVWCHEPGKQYDWFSEYRGLKLQIKSVNYWVSGYNRGELVPAGPVLNRTSPCFYPFQDITVDWKGNILPCCNVYPDEPEHRKWIAGNLADGRTIFDHYANSPLVDWRRGLLRFSPKGSPCETCSRLESADIATPENVNRMNIIADQLLK